MPNDDVFGERILSSGFCNGFLPIPRQGGSEEGTSYLAHYDDFFIGISWNFAFVSVSQKVNYQFLLNLDGSHTRVFQ